MVDYIGSNTLNYMDTKLLLAEFRLRIEALAPPSFVGVVFDRRCREPR